MIKKEKRTTKSKQFDDVYSRESPDSRSDSSTEASVESNKKSSGAEYKCDYCRDDITEETRIRCAECKDFDLCVTCFTQKLEVHPHKCTHKYKIINPIKTAIYDSDWTADEESLLLEGIGLFGYGNWVDVSEHVGSKSKYRCETHYERSYLKSEFAPFAKSLLTDKKQYLNQKEKGEDVKKLLKIASSFEKPIFPSLKTSPPPINDNSPQPKIHSSLINNSAMVGFSVERGDFEVEHENEAEKMLADMTFEETDTEEQKKLKLDVIRIYNRKLKDREMRKKFLLERGLSTISAKNKRKFNNDEKEIFENMKPFARFHSPESHDKLVNGLCNELRLRKQIEKLQNYRLNGLKTFTEINNFKKQILKLKTVNKFIPTSTVSTDNNKVVSKISKEDKENAKEFELEGSEGLEKLSEKEKEFCTTLELKPEEFLKIKQAIERETFIKGMIPKTDSTSLIKIKIHKTEQQINFVIFKNFNFDEEVCSGSIKRQKNE